MSELGHMLHVEPSPTDATGTKIMPPGCQCDPDEWGQNIIPICEHFRRGHRGVRWCKHCDHNRECHAQ